MKIVNITQAKANLSSLLREVKNGQKIIIGKANEPIAVLIKYESLSKERTPGALKGKIKISKDFDELPKDIADSFGMNS